MASPWLTVIIPTFNGERYLRDALNSLRMQRCQNFEVILIDDGSTDQTVAIAQSFLGRLPLQIVDNQHSGSWTQSTNLALDIATGEYISILHQDDFWHRDRVSRIQELAQDFPAAPVLLHSTRFVSTLQQSVGTLRYPFPERRYLTSDDVLARLFVQNFIAVPSVTFKRSIIKSAGPFKPALWYTGDWDMWLRLSTEGNWVYLDQPLAAFRVHSSAQTCTGGRSLLEYREQSEVILRQFSSEVRQRCRHPARVLKLARLSVEVNLLLFAIYRGWWPDLLATGRALLVSGPRGWLTYFAQSRISARLGARVVTILKKSWKENPQRASTPYEIGLEWQV